MSDHQGLRNLSGLHILLTYGCVSACDHCFVYGSPRSTEVFTLKRIREIISQAREVPSITTFYFEGGEPFLYYPLLIESIRLAREAGYECGIVTNGYWASSVEDAELNLRPLKDLGICDLSISDDPYHYDPEGPNPTKNAHQAAENLGLPVGKICIEPANIIKSEARGGEPVVGGGVLFKGRAADNLTEGLPRRPANSFTCCDEENFYEVGRVHIDPLGWTHICQGITAGNVFHKPLQNIIADYDPDAEPIIGPLARGGPVELAKQHQVEVGKTFVDACHMCFMIRRALIDRFPEKLAPRRLYGLTPDSQQ